MCLLTIVIIKNRTIFCFYRNAVGDNVIAKYEHYNKWSKQDYASYLSWYEIMCILAKLVSSFK